MKLIPGFDPSENKVTISIETNLINKYFPNLVGLVKDCPDVPRGIDVEQFSNNTAVISFPIGDEDDFKKTSTGVAINSRKMDSIQNVINDFVNCALRHELRKTEFIPLHGYPLEDLMKDVKNAAKAKRNLCLIKEYSEYLNMEKERLYKFTQLIIPADSNEWADVILLILEGKKGLKKLQDNYESKLSFVEWI